MDWLTVPVRDDVCVTLAVPVALDVSDCETVALVLGDSDSLGLRVSDGDCV